MAHIYQARPLPYPAAVEDHLLQPIHVADIGCLDICIHMYIYIYMYIYPRQHPDKSRSVTQRSGHAPAPHVLHAAHDAAHLWGQDRADDAPKLLASAATQYHHGVLLGESYDAVM